jgi:hypothetical protein
MKIKVITVNSNHDFRISLDFLRKLGKKNHEKERKNNNN